MVLKDAIFTKGPNFFTSGQIVWPFWPKNVEKNWQHCKEAANM
jgi:hypothetical protein